MQYVSQSWRCPWSSTERQDRAKARGLHVVTCAWPLIVPRKVMGLPDSNNDDRATPP
jgi:hypothetical protein